ncbi:unnamed protein product [Acidocella sp. C78]|uniref:cytochrome c oxidase subunit 3 n=1 Tax=Acidocella sp. C78 TaxID=1671486 RepID=UPI001BB9F0C1|nr:cytochrome c oxidase subunit 3 [Acidocella sp. C78]CAG4922458.1 unnamed protein product [Acidocella sp. C78]
MSAESHTAEGQIAGRVPHPYHLVEPSVWPLTGAMSAILIATGIIFVAHFNDYWFLIAGFLGAVSTMFVWWRDVVRESRTPGLHKLVTQIGLRYGMALFISSEVMFFVSFFWAYFNFFFYPRTRATCISRCGRRRISRRSIRSPCRCSTPWCCCSPARRSPGRITR